MESADVSAETIPAKFHPSKSFLSAENRSQKFSPAWRALTNTHMNTRILFLQTKAKLLPPPLDLWFLHAKQWLLDQIYKSPWVSDITDVFFAFKTATLAPELQVSMDPSPHLWFCAFTTASLWPELIVSMGPRSHLSFCACKTAWLAPELLVSMGSRLHLSFCACKTTWLASELLVSMRPSPDLWFLHSKQRIFDKNYKSLWVPDFACWFVHEKQRD